MTSTGRSTFLDRLRILANALNDPLLIDKPITDVEHNERARYLRNGLSIIAFNTLEDFIKKRIEELLYKISNSATPFNSLPEKLQTSILLNSLKGIHSIGSRKHKNGEDWKLFIQQEVVKLTSVAASPYQASALGYGSEKSNIDQADIPTFLASFQVKGGWDSIEQITNLIGCSLMAPGTFFSNAAARRHNAAHNPLASALHPDIEQYCISVKALALAIDFLLSRAAKYIIANDANYLINKKKVEPTDVAFRFIRRINSGFVEMSQNNTKGIARFANETDAINSLTSRANYQNQMIVVVDYPGKVLNWYTSF